MTAIDAFGVEDVAMLDPGGNDVVVRIGASGICHSDVSVFTGDSPMPPPVVLGHEAAGVVEWVSSDATVNISPLGLLIEDRCLRGSYFGGTRALRDFPRYVELIESGRLDLSSLISQRISLDDVGGALAFPASDAIRSVVVSAVE